MLIINICFYLDVHLPRLGHEHIDHDAEYVGLRDHHFEASFCWRLRAFLISLHGGRSIVVLVFVYASSKSLNILRIKILATKV